MRKITLLVIVLSVLGGYVLRKLQRTIPAVESDEFFDEYEDEGKDTPIAKTVAQHTTALLLLAAFLGITAGTLFGQMQRIGDLKDDLRLLYELSILSGETSLIVPERSDPIPIIPEYQSELTELMDTHCTGSCEGYWSSLIVYGNLAGSFYGDSCDNSFTVPVMLDRITIMYAARNHAHKWIEPDIRTGSDSVEHVCELVVWLDPSQPLEYASAR